MNDAVLLDGPINETVSLEERELILTGMVEQGGDLVTALAILGLELVFDDSHPQKRYLRISNLVPPRLQ